MQHAVSACRAGFSQFLHPLRVISQFFTRLIISRFFGIAHVKRFALGTPHTCRGHTSRPQDAGKAGYHVPRSGTHRSDRRTKKNRRRRFRTGIGVKGFEPPTSCSQTRPGPRFPLRNKRSRRFLFRKTCAPALLFPLFPPAPVPVMVKHVVKNKLAPENRTFTVSGSDKFQ